MIKIDDLDRIADGAFLPFTYLTSVDLRQWPNGEPRKEWRLGIRVLTQARDDGRLRVLPKNQTATLGRWFKDYIYDPKSVKYGTEFQRKSHKTGATNEAINQMGVAGDSV